MQTDLPWVDLKCAPWQALKLRDEKISRYLPTRALNIAVNKSRRPTHELPLCIRTRNSFDMAGGSESKNTFSGREPRRRQKTIFHFIYDTKRLQFLFDFSLQTDFFSLSLRLVFFRSSLTSPIASCWKIMEKKANGVEKAKCFPLNMLSKEKFSEIFIRFFGGGAEATLDKSWGRRPFSPSGRVSSRQSSSN